MAKSEILIKLLLQIRAYTVCPGLSVRIFGDFIIHANCEVSYGTLLKSIIFMQLHVYVLYVVFELILESILHFR